MKWGNMWLGRTFSPYLCLLQLFITLDLLAFYKSVIDIDSGKCREIFQGISNVSQFLRGSNISSNPRGFFKHEMFFLADNRLQCCGFLTSHSLTAKLTCSKVSFFFFFLQVICDSFWRDNCLNINKWPAPIERFQFSQGIYLLSIYYQFFQHNFLPSKHYPSPEYV